MKFSSRLAVVDPEDPQQDVRRLSEAVDVLGGKDHLSEADQLGAPSFLLEYNLQDKFSFCASGYVRVGLEGGSASLSLNAWCVGLPIDGPLSSSFRRAAQSSTNRQKSAVSCLFTKLNFRT